MEKNRKKSNKLIKRKNLILELRRQGVKRANSDALYLLEKYLEKNLSKLINEIKEERDIQGRKTIKKQDVKKVLSKDKANKEIDFEI